MNMTVTNITSRDPILADAEFRDDILTLAGADVIAPGTILARDSVSQKLVLFVKGGSTNQNGIPKAILTYQVTTTGAGDVRIRAGVAGKFRREELIIDADGTGANIDAAVLDQLRDYSLVPINVTELNIVDNQ